MLKFDRREFLGGIVAIWGLSWTEQLSLYLDDNNEEEGEDEVDPEEPRKTFRSSGHDGMLVAQRGSPKAQVDVVVYPKHAQPIGVEVSFDMISMGAAMTPEDARDLAEELLQCTGDVDGHRH